MHFKIVVLLFLIEYHNDKFDLNLSRILEAWV